MGEVYRARDTRLGRDVAIKVLPEALANDPDRLRRLEQEAKTIATLNHPNIVGIHDIGSQEARRYLVSELLEGQTLRETLEHGALPLKRVIQYAEAIAKGLGAAHEKGIVHRDLKPENIFITKDGRVKILDFGLAKLVLPEENLGAVATMTSPGTVAGVVMGTIGYMSPEQVRGTPSDARSDIFSFGIVLYEMLTGKRAFKRDTAAETMTAILREEPPELTETGWQGPLGLQKILGRCLEKSPERRFQSASDLGFAIEALSGSSTGLGTQAHPAIEVRRSWLPWAAGVVGFLALAVGAWMVGKSPTVKTQPKFKRLTYQQGYLTNARFAKDGGMIAYSAQWGNDPLCVYTVRTEFPQSTKADLPDANLLALSTNGDMELSVQPVYHTNFIDGTLALAQMMGGTPRGLENDAISADFAPDGKTLAVARAANQKVQLEYPQGKVIYTTSGYVDYLRVSPNGKEIAFLEHPVFDDDRGWVAVIDEAGNRRQLTKEFATVQGLAWSRRAKELWFTAADSSTDRSLRAVTLSGNTREILVAPRSLRLLDIAADGRVLLASEELRSEIHAIDPATGKERNGLEWFNGSGLADISSDGRAILYSEWGGPAGELYLVVYRKTDGSAPTGLGEGTDPKLSPDGSMVAAPVLTRPPKLALHPIGTGESQRLELGELVALIHLAWFPDGNHMLLLGAKSGEALRSYEMDLAGGKPVALGPAGFLGFAVANDGKRVFGRNQAGQPVVFDKDKQSMSVAPGIGAREQIQKWTEDGQALLTSTATPWEAEMYRVDVASGKRTLLQRVEPSDKAGSTINLRLYYAEKSKTYAYNARRIVSILYAVEGL